MSAHRFIELNDTVHRVCNNCYSFTGGLTPLADEQKNYEDLINSVKTPEQALDELGCFRICCRNNILRPIHYQLRYTPPAVVFEGKVDDKNMEIPKSSVKIILDFP